jgi:uncharacterized protein YeaC (DUF1315 family)
LRELVEDYQHMVLEVGFWKDVTLTQCQHEQCVAFRLTKRKREKLTFHGDPEPCAKCRMDYCRRHMEQHTCV